jgi:hypothetical protein
MLGLDDPSLHLVEGCSMRSKSEIDTILRNVQARLDAKQAQTGVHLRVVQDDYLEDDNWLNLIVLPDSHDVRAHQYVDTLSEVEMELRNDGVRDVLLVPALAE